MDPSFKGKYDTIRGGGLGFYEMDRGLIAVWGKESVQFLDGLISNDVKTLADGAEMLAAFPNAQGRLLAVVRVKREGERFLIETEGATREKVFQNLFRFTFAGDFFVEDLSERYRFHAFFGGVAGIPASVANVVYDPELLAGHFIPNEELDEYRKSLSAIGAVAIDADLYEVLRIESGILKYGIDVDESTIVPELGLAGLISYAKGCYIGQEIIARIHFRGHVAKSLTGLVIEADESDQSAVVSGLELTDGDGRNAGRITSVTFSPNLESVIAIAVVRYDHLAPGTRVNAGQYSAVVSPLPFLM